VRSTVANTQRAELAPIPRFGDDSQFVAHAIDARPRLARSTPIGADAPERRGFSIFTGFVTTERERPNVCVRVLLRQAGTTVDEVLKAGGTVPRVSEPADAGAVTARDAAAGAGRGVVKGLD
jgi:hypothetical protein